MVKTTAVDTGSNIELKQFPRTRVDADSDNGSVGEISSIAPTTITTTPPAKKKRLMFKKSWLFWWNSEEWWSCWIGLIFFGCIASAVKHNIPSPEFIPWDKNPFSTFATAGNYGLLVICVAMGLLLWLAMAATNAPNWRKFPLGYSAVFIIALISKMLASNGNDESYNFFIFSYLFFSQLFFIREVSVILFGQLF